MMRGNTVIVLLKRSYHLYVTVSAQGDGLPIKRLLIYLMNDIPLVSQFVRVLYLRFRRLSIPVIRLQGHGIRDSMSFLTTPYC